MLAQRIVTVALRRRAIGAHLQRLDERCFTDRGAHRKGLKASEICSSSRGPLSSVRRKENAYREVDTRRGKLESRPEKSSDRRVARVGLVRQKGVR